MPNEPSPFEGDRTTPPPTEDGVAAKRAYQPPRLTVYGNLVELTHGSRVNVNGDVTFAGSGAGNS